MTRSNRNTRLPIQSLFQTLARQRQMTSLIDQEILASGDTFSYDKADWVKLWCDPGHAVTSDCGTITAYRAITIDGTLLWYVFREGKTRGYHASAQDPIAAIDEASNAWMRRKQIKARWKDIEKIATDLRTGRQSFEVRVSDAHASPLCSLGIDGFMRSVGLGGFSRISGRLAGMLMKVEPQLGFVIYEAWRRMQADATYPARTPSPRLTHIGVSH
jgi:hypothetical protein